MKIPRLHLVELHDLAWFPASIREYLTNSLAFFWALQLPGGRSGARVASEVLVRLVGQGGARIVDLCSGGGGPVAALASHLPQGVRVRLTDLYPNLPAFQAAASAHPGVIDFSPTPVNATQCSEPCELRTQFASFHHFAPNSAVALLADAVRASQAIAIFEYTERTLLTTVLYLLGLVPLVLLLTPFMPRLTLHRLFFTYCIPVVPAVLLFDGIVSCLRTYTKEEFLRLARRADPQEHFDWVVTETTANWGIMPVISYVGVPKARVSAVPSGRG